MSKTETVRKLLTEQSIEYTTDEGICCEITRWTRDGHSYSFYEFDDGSTVAGTSLLDATPEQAVNATITKTAKRIVVSNGEYGYSRCSLCDCTVGRFDKFCKHCGTKLEDK